MKLSHNITVRNEDNMDLMSRYPDHHFDIAIVDPPYFDGPNKLGYYGNGWSRIGVKRDPYQKIGQWDVPGEEYFKELYRVSKHQIIWGCNYYPQFIKGPGRFIWDKVNAGSSFSDAEIAYCSLHDATRLFRYMWNGMMQGKSITEGHIMQGNKKLNEKRIHPTQKPILLYKHLLSTYAKQGDKILDTHLGSMSIAIACADYDFELVGCELDKDYYNAGVKRLKNHLSQMKINFDI